MVLITKIVKDSWCLEFSTFQNVEFMCSWFDFLSHTLVCPPLNFWVMLFKKASQLMLQFNVFNKCTWFGCSILSKLHTPSEKGWVQHYLL